MIWKFVIMVVTLVVTNSVFAGYVVDVTFSGDTNDIYSVEIQDGKGQKEFDAFLEIQDSEKIGLCENIVVTDFKADKQKVSMSIKATSNALNGFNTVVVDGKRRKFPILRIKEFSLSSLTLFLDTWVVLGGLTQADSPSKPTMVRVREEASSKTLESDK